MLDKKLLEKYQLVFQRNYKFFYNLWNKKDISEISNNDLIFIGYSLFEFSKRIINKSKRNLLLSESRDVLNLICIEDLNEYEKAIYDEFLFFIDLSDYSDEEILLKLEENVVDFPFLGKSMLKLARIKIDEKKYDDALVLAEKLLSIFPSDTYLEYFYFDLLILLDKKAVARKKIKDTENKIIKLIFLYVCSERNILFNFAIGLINLFISYLIIEKIYLGLGVVILLVVLINFLFFLYRYLTIIMFKNDWIKKIFVSVPILVLFHIVRLFLL